ncbi:MAG: MFS transporter [Sphingobium sp.]|nr:MFS transporter [Sphingobium sp.]
MADNQAGGAGTISAGRSWLGFLLVLLSLVVEGFDLQAANMAAPNIVSSFGITRADIGPLLSASLFGVLLGAMFLAPLGDRFGRRTIIIGACTAYGVLSLIAAVATGITELVALRFLIGIGIGAVLPNALALGGEMAPQRLLATATGMIGIGITFGGTVAGAVAAILFKQGYGWREVFMAGGVLPLIIAALLWLGLPESPALKRGEVRSGGNVLTLLAPGERAKTFAIWLAFGLVLMINYLLTGWIPLIINAQGYSQSEAAWIATAGHGGGVIGGVIASLALARWRWPVVGAFAAMAALVMILLAGADWGATALTALIVLQGVFIVGTQNALNGSAGATYPAETRALGLGWALGVGRVGSVVGPLAGSAALMLGLGQPREFFFLPIVPLLVAAALAAYLTRATKSPSLASVGD